MAPQVVSCRVVAATTMGFETELGEGGVFAVCPVSVGRRDLLASANDEAVLIWDLQSGEQHASHEGHHSEVNAVCAVTVDGRELLASGSDDRTVRIWDPQTGEQQAVLRGHQGKVNAVCAVTVGGRELLASGSGDETVRIWDPQTGTCLLTLPAQYPVLGAARVGDVLALGLDACILVITLDAVA